MLTNCGAAATLSQLGLWGPGLSWPLTAGWCHWHPKTPPISPLCCSWVAGELREPLRSACLLQAEVPSSREVLRARRGAHSSHKRATCFAGPVPSLCISPFITCTSFLHGSFPRPLDPPENKCCRSFSFWYPSGGKNSSSFCEDAMKSKLKYGSTLLCWRAYAFSCRYSG